MVEPDRETERVMLLPRGVAATFAARAEEQTKTAMRRRWLGGHFTMDAPLRRVNFFNGLMLTAADMAAEQEYHRTARYLHNRVHGYGVLSGLDVAVTDGHVEVSRGMGIDTCGREILLSEAVTLDLEPQQDARLWVRDLVIGWHETPERPVPGPDGTVHFARWVEQPELALGVEGGAAAEELVLARLTRTSGGEVDVDTSVRRPFGPA